jgi:hypothetical protein
MPAIPRETILSQCTQTTASHSGCTRPTFWFDFVCSQEVSSARSRLNIKFVHSTWRNLWSRPGFDILGKAASEMPFGCGNGQKYISRPTMRDDTHRKHAFAGHFSLTVSGTPGPAAPVGAGVQRAAAEAAAPAAIT